MRDKRTVDELSIEELERILAIKKREARQSRLDRMRGSGRVIEAQPRSTPAPSLPPLEELLNDPYPTFEEPRIAARKPNEPRRKRGETSAWQRFVDRSLLVIEVAAVVGLVGIGIVLVSGIFTLQEQTAEAQRSAQEIIRASIPTLAPTPTLNLADIVLPGGHTPPIGPEGAQFNFEEIPVNLRAQFRDQIFLPPNISRPAPQPETPLRVIIPDLNIDEPIVQGTDWEALKLGVGQHLNDATPAQRGSNIVLAAHNDIYGKIFQHIDQLRAGSIIRIQTQTRMYEFVVTGSEVVRPNEVRVMEPRGYTAVTLISCYPYQVNTHRYIVYAQLNDS
jgi:sortase A